MSSETRAYRGGARLLHWTMFLALMVQLVLGYSMERFDDVLEGPVDRWLGGEEENLLIFHAGLGVMILVLASIRLAYRLRVGLPPWAATLTAFERRLAHRTEVVLYSLMFLIPLTGLALVTISGEDWDLFGREFDTPFELVDDDLLLPAHIATHIVFFMALAAHIGLVLKHQVVNRDGLIKRML